MAKRTTFILPAETIETLKRLSDEMSCTQSEVLESGISNVDLNQDLLDKLKQMFLSNKFDSKRHSIALQEKTLEKLDFLKKVHKCSRTVIIWLGINITDHLHSDNKKKKYLAAKELKVVAYKLYIKQRELLKNATKLYENLDDNGIINDLEISTWHLDEALGAIYSQISNYEKSNKEETIEN